MNLMEEFGGAITLKDIKGMNAKERETWSEIVRLKNRRRTADRLIKEAMSGNRR